VRVASSPAHAAAAGASSTSTHAGWRPGHATLSSAKLSQDLSATTLALAWASSARRAGRPSVGMASNAGRSMPSGSEASSVTPPARKTRSSPAPARMAAATASRRQGRAPRDQ
jgi:hypothetical protein